MNETQDVTLKKIYALLVRVQQQTEATRRALGSLKEEMKKNGNG